MGRGTLLDKITSAITIAGNFILMNLVFLVTSIPIVTMGQAWCGLLSAMRYNIRGDRWQDGFKAGFKKRFLRGTVMWVVMLVIDLYLMIDMIATVDHFGLDVPSVMACLAFAVMAMLTFSMQMLNVYIPTKVGQWLRNSANMLFKSPLELLLAAAAFWLPFALLWRWTGVFLYTVWIFIAAYFPIVAIVSTMLLKNTLIHYLLEARATGTLLAEEGSAGKKTDSEEEEA